MMGRWQIHAVLVLRKLPELFPHPDPISWKVQQIFNAYEVGRSKFSNHEIQHYEETKPKNEDDEVETLIKETAQDKLDKWTKEKSNFTFGQYDDRLSKTQYLFFKQKFTSSDDQERWLMPQIEYDSSLDSTLLDTARRALKVRLNIDTGYKVISKIPSSYYSFNYPKKLVDTIGYRGCKVFFLKANLENPNKTVSQLLDDVDNKNIKWLTIDEAETVIRKNYLKALSKGLLSENRVNVNEVLMKASGLAASLKNQVGARN